MLVPWRVKSAYCTVLEFNCYEPKEDGGRFQEDECGGWAAYSPGYERNMRCQQWNTTVSGTVLKTYFHGQILPLIQKLFLLTLQNAKQQQHMIQ